MAAFIQGHIAALDHTQTSDAATAQQYQNQMLLALCQGIIDEITGNAVVTTTSGAPDGEHVGVIT